MKDYFRKPTTRALIDMLLIMIALILIPTGFIHLLTWMGLDPVGTLLLFGLWLIMWSIYKSRLEKYESSQDSTENDEDQPLNS